MPISLAALALASALATPPAEPKPFTVHEWGTFTSYSTPSLSNVPYTTQIAQDLPPFVQARFISERWQPSDCGDFVKSILVCTNRMETPVIYFHAPEPMQVSVEVRMPQGLITEVYPPVTAATPVKLDKPAITPDGSMVRWDNVKIVPEQCCDFIALPDAGASHYAHARKTKGDTVHVAADGKDLAERFLFYRGVANTDLGLSAKPLGRDRFLLSTAAPATFTHAFAVEVRNGRLRYQQFKDVQSGATLTLPSSPSSDTALAADMTGALTAAGLNQDEAAAMVATWKHHWFGEDGARILVLLPQSIIDHTLPLTISPTPSKTTRVFVSRLEMLTPERADEVESVLRRMDVAEPLAKELEAAGLSTLGRFKDAAIKAVREHMANNTDGC